MREEHSKLYKIVLTGLMAALCYVCFAFLKIPIPTIGGDFVALHVGNAFCVLAALLLGGSLRRAGRIPGDDGGGPAGPGLRDQRPQNLCSQILHRAHRRLHRPPGRPHHGEPRRKIRVQMDAHRLGSLPGVQRDRRPGGGVSVQKFYPGNPGAGGQDHDHLGGGG